MVKVVINCDMGEGAGNDALIMPFIHSANIACGYHAGDVQTMYDTIALAMKHKVTIGAHVSYADKANFGRNEMNLPMNEVYELITQQLKLMQDIAHSSGTRVTHVKPHGALYNQSAKDKNLANTIANAIKNFNAGLVLYGLSGSHSITEAKAVGLKTYSEVFADRVYVDDGTLMPRSQQGALIEDKSKAVQQVVQLINSQTVTSYTGKIISIVAETICLHGDGIHAVEFAKAIHQAINK